MCDVYQIGAICDTLGLGLMIRYRGSENSLFELVLPQLFRGFAEGLVGFPVQALIQVSRREIFTLEAEQAS